MAWDLKDEDLVKRIADATAPPSDLRSLLSDELWANAFSMWATDLGYQRGDYKASSLHHLWADLDYGTAGETIYAQYVQPSGAATLPWPSNLSSYFERVTNGMDSDYTNALAETRRAATEMLEPYASMFRDDIRALQSQHVGQPTPVPIKMVEPDMGTVDRINQAVLKDLPEFRSEKDNLAESKVTFYATPSVVLIGDNHAASYYEYLNAVGHTVGTITMMRRGGAFSPGRVEVGLLEVIQAGGEAYAGVPPDQDDVRQAVTDAIGRVSNKQVKHIK